MRRLSEIRSFSCRFCHEPYLLVLVYQARLGLVLCHDFANHPTQKDDSSGLSYDCTGTIGLGRRKEGQRAGSVRCSAELVKERRLTFRLGGQQDANRRRSAVMMLIEGSDWVEILA
jgi:hypothetical protein